MSKVIKSPEIVDPAVVVGELEPRAGLTTETLEEEGLASAPALEDDDEFLIEYDEIEEAAGPVGRGARRA